jgi:hypothetical protein
MLPAEALRHIHTLIVGAASIATERQQRVLLECIAELTRKGLERTTPIVHQLGDTDGTPQVPH